MSRTFKPMILVAALAALALPLILVAQVQNEGLANGIIAARKKNAALMAQYTWNSTTQVTSNDKVQDVRVDQVNLGPDGNLQRTVINDQPGQLPHGFLRRAAAEGQRKEIEKQVKEVSKIVDQYTLPSAGAVINFLAGAQVQPMTTPAGSTVLQVNGTGVVSPGDTFAMTVNGTTLQPISVQITTQYNGNPITVNGTFRTTAAGLNHLQYATVTINGDKTVNVNIHNYDYVPNN